MLSTIQRLVARIKGILLRPTAEWPAVADEPSTPGSILVGYVAPLAAIGAIATFISQSVIGIGAGFLGTYRVPILKGLSMAVVNYGLAIAGVLVIALLVNALAPVFGGQRDALRALKVTAYSYTPAWVASVFFIVPVLSSVAIVAAFYGLYLLYLGLPVLMRAATEKSLAYTAATAVASIVVAIVVAGVTTLMFGS